MPLTAGGLAPLTDDLAREEQGVVDVDDVDDVDGDCGVDHRDVVSPDELVDVERERLSAEKRMAPRM